MTYDMTAIQDRLREKQNGRRFTHTLGVQYTSACLAMKYGADIHRAQLAGLLHDCAKHKKPDKLLAFCQERQLPVTAAQQRQPFLLHGIVGAYVAREKYGVDDPEILSAIQWHTTGKPDMSLLEKIVFTADYIEPNRNMAPNLDELRKISFEDLDDAIYRILKQTLEYLKSTPEDIDETTEITFKYYKTILGH